MQIEWIATQMLKVDSILTLISALVHQIFGDVMLGDLIGKRVLNERGEEVHKTWNVFSVFMSCQVSFQMWTNQMQDTLNSKKKGDAAYRKKLFEAAIECCTQGLWFVLQFVHNGVYVIA
ncbi:hypothetical protein C5167_014553 [Papaver somniferum]|uniref:Serine/threonine-protein kinase BSK1-like TPR repeats domain-containing protein n=1 Tax=Papaver somniferum TaxID=3469 RepID=A0A4Y7J7J9_PAPSO|nr:hypothetical protein C5167_014553 [Papaver somniferum]